MYDHSWLQIFALTELLTVIICHVNCFVCFVIAGAMLNIVQDSALLEAIGCQMEMVRSLYNVIEYLFLILSKSYLTVLELNLGPHTC